MKIRRRDIDGDYVLGKGNAIIPDGSDAVTELLGNRLRLFRGEWFLDASAGLAVFDDGTAQDAIMKPGSGAFAEAEIKRIVLSTEGVSAILEFSMDLDHETRAAQASIVFSDVYGNTPSMEVSFP